jgi:predicted Zn-dependent protease
MDDPRRPGVTRREFLELSALASAAALAGCATNPVTGRRELMLISPADEARMDRQASPHQFSADYGPLQDATANAYLAQVGRDLARGSHRPDVPYSFRGVNASYVNAYAFPGGSIAATRGILLSLDNEAELAALLGHEIGHVNARHTAHAMSKNLLIAGGLGLTVALLGSSEKYEAYAPWVAGLGAIGAGVLLARYSREDERQADELGMEYMVRAGHNPEGMVGLMDKLRRLGKGRPDVIELMFATHPMSDERYHTAAARAAARYAGERSRPLHRERYQDSLAALRGRQAAVQEIQDGDEQARGGKWDGALARYGRALDLAPDDYEALLKAALCHLRRQNPAEGLRLASAAKAAYPSEPQAWHVSGRAALALGRHDAALAEFQRYEERLPGNPMTTFLQARALDGMGRASDAAQGYTRFLQMQSEGEEAEFARRRLSEMAQPQ